MTKEAKAPTEITEATLDDVSGGPHYRNWHGPLYAAAPAESQAADKPKKGFTAEPMGWDNVKN